MVLKEDKVINFFSVEMQKEMLKYCDRINNSTADVFVFMARKAACFFQVLVENGCIDPDILDKKIITDRAVDFSLGYVKDKKVAIVDDVIFSGTTIAKMIKCLESAGSSEVEIIVLAINDETCRMSFAHAGGEDKLDRKQCTKLNNEECTKLCSDISKALSMIGKPYDVDFPAYHDIYCKNDDLKWTYFPQYFKWYNIANAFQRIADIDVYTIVPNNHFLNIVWRFLGIDLGEIAEIKIRVYLYEQNKSECRIKFLPLAILNEMSATMIDDVFGRIIECCRENKKDYMKLFQENTAKFRFIQYFIAGIAFETFLLLVNYDIPDLRKYSIPYLFGYDFEKELRDLLRKERQYLKQEFSGLRTTYSQVECSRREEIEAELLGFDYTDLGDLTGIGSCDITGILMKPFKYWFDYKEKSVREAMAHEDINLDNEFFTGITRLEEGFSSRALCKIISRLSKRYHVKDVVAIFLDRAIDLGILVPIVYHNKQRNYYCRAYRHGEDLPYSDIDMKIIFYFIRCFIEERDCEITISQLHNILALFLQLGIKNKLFNEFEGFDFSDLLTVQYGTDGAVLSVVKAENALENIYPYVRDVPYCVWLSKILMRDGYIEQKYGQEHYYVIKAERIKQADVTLARTTQTSVAIIANMLSRWYFFSQETNARKAFSFNISVLTTCYNANTFASALLADLYTSSLDVEKTILPILDNPDVEENKLYIRDILRRKSAFHAINMGRKMFNCYRKDEDGISGVEHSIYSVEKMFENDRLAKLNWMQYWMEYIQMIPSQNDLDKNAILAVEYVYCYNVLYRRIEQYYNSEKHSQIQIEIDDLKREIVLKLDDAINPFILELTSIQQLKNYALRLNEEVKRDMLMIEQSIVRNRKYTIQVFSDCIICQMNKRKKEQAFAVFEKIRDKYFENMGAKAIWIDISSEDKGIYAFLVKGESGLRNKLMEASIAMHKIFLKELLYVKTIVVSGLPKGNQYVQNMKENNQRNIQLFKVLTGDLFRKCFVNENSELPEYVITWNCLSVDREIAEDLERVTTELPAYVQEDLKSLKTRERKEYLYMSFYEKRKTIGIMTVIAPEAKAVKEYFEMKKMGNEYGDRRSKRIYYKSTVRGDSEWYDVIMTQCPMQGNQAAVSTYDGLNRDFKLDYVVLLGVAGSLNEEKLKVCDVVIAKEVIDGQLGKETGENEFQSEITTYTPNAMVNGIINDYITFSGEHASSEGSIAKTFKCVYEPICDNNHVIGSQDSQFIKNLKEHVSRKVLAVEMESAGFMHAAYVAGGLNTGCDNVIVIRGISDYADPDKPSDDRYHYPAAVNAAIVLKELITSL